MENSARMKLAVSENLQLTKQGYIQIENLDSLPASMQVNGLEYQAQIVDAVPNIRKGESTKDGKTIKWKIGSIKVNATIEETTYTFRVGVDLDSYLESPSNEGDTVNVKVREYLDKKTDELKYTSSLSK